MTASQLDDLPVELFHHIFNYLSACEIFYAFANLSSYINSILASYTNYQINCKAISKNHFDLICQHILPDQVITLILSDDEDTPGLIDLFLSRFQIQQFTRLRGLKLIDIGPEFWASIITQIVTLKYLRSFLFDLPYRNSTWICKLSRAEVTQVQISLLNTYATIFPQLYQLKFYNTNFSNFVSFPHLRHLILTQSSTELIKHISIVTPHLQTLETSFFINTVSSDLIPFMPQLKCLILEISGSAVSINAFEQMLSNLPCLRHLKLFASCKNDVINGKRWETCARNLLTFKFSFQISNKVVSEQLNSFQTPFWVKVKRWFVAYANGCFFSVSQSTIPDMSFEFQLPECTTMRNVDIFYQSTHQLELRKNSNYLKSHFLNVETLILSDPPCCSIIKKVIDLCQVRNLKIYCLKKTFPIITLINEMPNLCQLSLKYNNGNFVERVRHKVLENIRMLTGTFDTLMAANENNIKNLFTVFPHLEHLHLHHQCSIEEIHECLHGFKYLSTASFTYMKWNSVEDQRRYRLQIQSSLDKMRYENGWDFTYRFDPLRVYLWVGSRETRHQN